MKTSENTIYIKETKNDQVFLRGIIYNFKNLDEININSRQYYIKFMKEEQTPRYTTKISIKNELNIDPIKIFKIIQEQIEEIKIINNGIYFTNLVPFIIRKNKLDELKIELSKIN